MKKCPIQEFVENVNKEFDGLEERGIGARIDDEPKIHQVKIQILPMSRRQFIASMLRGILRAEGENLPACIIEPHTVSDNICQDCKFYKE